MEGGRGGGLRVQKGGGSSSLWLSTLQSFKVHGWKFEIAIDQELIWGVHSSILISLHWERLV